MNKDGLSLLSCWAGDLVHMGCFISRDVSSRMRAEEGVSRVQIENNVISYLSSSV